MIQPVEIADACLNIRLRILQQILLQNFVVSAQTEFFPHLLLMFLLRQTTNAKYDQILTAVRFPLASRWCGSGRNVLVDVSTKSQSLR